ncbi:asparagine synthase (glutamine-hydrolyzing) [Bacillus cereus VD133]|uniref:asparagine synthase (glutamine-hydrolyzing) n=1 Tax=Bacillus cereus VD133 TaxID=1053233 RepID=A0A9W5PKX1_BACCE|nr:asparagine synthase (glutamine-hydrolyzing) [Bacillus cereus]EOO25855.1 asparagine synthase (glutamine-hydrolyzing) [Bacillus cereus VD133]
MCGFVGYTDTRNLDNQFIIKNMADQIKHRGPDDEGYHFGKHVTFGFRRLAIIDIDHGKQPLYNEDKSMVLVFNGEIYNYKEIRDELILKGHQFKTESDSEVLIHGYEEYGPNLLNKLRGMFAFVIWDEKKQKLFGARDIFGIKPFYYYQKENKFIFGSEVKGLLPHPNLDKEFNLPLLPAYLSFEYIPSHETLFKNIYKLLPGHYFEYHDGKLDIHSYYDINYNIDSSQSLESSIESISSTFKRSIKDHSVSDVKIGSFLSSGIDSSFVLNEIAKIDDTKSFSAGYSEEKYSELDYSSEFSDLIKVPNIIRKISANEFFEVMPQIQYYMDEPLSNPSAVPLYFIANKASEEVKVVLSGEGADELFGGYNQYSESLIYQKYQQVPKALRKTLANIAAKLPEFKGRRFLTRGALPISQRYFRIDYIFNFQERQKLLQDKELNIDCVDMVQNIFDKCSHLDELSQMQYFDLHTWLVNDILLKADRMSMANSIELRVPFLDRTLLELALKLPPEYRVNTENTKVALRKAALKELPAKTANKKKLGFPSPLAEWMKQEKFYNQIKEKFQSEVASKYFNVDYLVELIELHKTRKEQNMQKIWSIYCFIVWYECFFEK